MKPEVKYEAIVLGASAGGIQIVTDLINTLPEDFSLPIIIVIHLPKTSDGVWPALLNSKSKITVKEADEKEFVKAGTAYIAPANYHLLLESDLSLSLTIDEHVHFARPSIDVLFETAAESCRKTVIGIVCTGGNADGAAGLLRIKRNGGLTIVQDPETAEVSLMPIAAIETARPDYILSHRDILKFILDIHHKQKVYEFEN